MRISLVFTLVLILAGLPMLSGCGGGEKSEPSALEKLQETAKNLETASKELQQVGEEQGEPVPPVSFRTLINYLPANVANLAKGEPSGETMNMGEWNFSQASARYEQGEVNASVEIFDYAHIGTLYAPFKMLVKMKLNKESTTGYERSTEIAGFPAYETWNNKDQRAELTVLVGDRFIVKIQTGKLPELTARRTAEGMDLKKLAKETGPAA
ncbi:MAG TPA: hypothetical protein PK916_15905 [Bacteroidota bacterium]|nr:hypothetical protein [Bacteroidota bacterium]